MASHYLESSGMPDYLKRRIGSKAGQQRVINLEGHLVLVLHRPPKPDEKERSARYFWRDDNGEWQESEGNGEYLTLTQHIDQYAEIVDDLDEQEEQVSTAGEIFQLLALLGPIARSSRHLLETLKAAHQIWPDDTILLEARDRAAEVERNADLLASEARNALDFLIAKRSEEQLESSLHMANASHKMTLLAAFFLPLMTLATIFGMNLETGIETRDAPVPFLITMCSGGLMGFCLFAVLTWNAEFRAFKKRVQVIGKIPIIPVAMIKMPFDRKK